MTMGIVLGFVLFLVLAAVMSSRSTKKKKRAVAHLEQELEAVRNFSILDLVDSEVAELGLAEVSGASGIPPSVLLRTWRDGKKVVDGCSDRDRLRFVLKDGVSAAIATDEDVTLECAD